MYTDKYAVDRCFLMTFCAIQSTHFCPRQDVEYYVFIINLKQTLLQHCIVKFCVFSL